MKIFGLEYYATRTDGLCWPSTWFLKPEKAKSSTIAGRKLAPSRRTITHGRVHGPQLHPLLTPSGQIKNGLAFVLSNSSTNTASMPVKGSHMDVARLDLSYKRLL